MARKAKRSEGPVSGAVATAAACCVDERGEKKRALPTPHAPPHARPTPPTLALTPRFRFTPLHPHTRARAPHNGSPCVTGRSTRPLSSLRLPTKPTHSRRFLGAAARPRALCRQRPFSFRLLANAVRAHDRIQRERGWSAHPTGLARPRNVHRGGGVGPAGRACPIATRLSLAAQARRRRARAEKAHGARRNLRRRRTRPSRRVLVRARPYRPC